MKSYLSNYDVALSGPEPLVPIIYSCRVITTINARVIRCSCDELIGKHNDTVDLQDIFSIGPGESRPKLKQQIDRFSQFIFSGMFANPSINLPLLVNNAARMLKFRRQQRQIIPPGLRSKITFLSGFLVITGYKALEPPPG